jgi:hypothetical protein
VAYRRRADHERAKRWRQWIPANRATLERIGLPLSIYQDVSHWEDFLANGHLHWHSDGPPFDFSELAQDRLEELRALLERDYSEHPPSLLRWLRVRLGRMD